MHLSKPTGRDSTKVRLTVGKLKRFLRMLGESLDGVRTVTKQSAYITNA